MQTKRALISVADKTGIAEFATCLQALAFEIISTGGTAAVLREAGLKVTDVSDLTGFPEMLDGRVKTLHPHIYAAILARRGVDDAALAEYGIANIDLVVVNLYPFSQTIAKPDCDLAQAIENIDIGGPALLRAAAKNFAWVSVLVDHHDFADVLNQLRSDGATEQATRSRLAQKAFVHTASYDAAIARYLATATQTEQGDTCDDNFAAQLTLQFNRRQSLRYGENPQQRAAFYVEAEPVGMAAVQQLQGKALSFNNIVDAETAMATVVGFERCACVIVKHANPCGVALGQLPHEAYTRAHRTDPTSAFGGIVAFNREMDRLTAEAIIERQFVEVIIAPAVNAQAQAILAIKPNIRVLQCGRWPHPYRGLDFKRVSGGLLVQDTDHTELQRSDLQVVSQRQPSEREYNDMLFAWRVVRFVKSNAIVFCREQMTIGIGAGQMSRVYSSRIAAQKAADEGLSMQDTVMASDAFFPFRDGIDEAAKAGARAVIQPGGSKRDPETIAAANEHDMAMVFTGVRHFRH